MILLVLETSGMLQRDRRGVSFGAGREPLTYVVSRDVDRITATDLYSRETRWDVARTNDPRAFVLADVTMPHDPERISVERMDMRKLAFADNSFDFAYSTGAIEHIGDDADFVAHFREAHRVLKPGGIYVLTTAVNFSGVTLAIPGNHYFAPQHLVDLANRSPLHADPAFDCRLAPHSGNSPIPDALIAHGLARVSRWAPCVISVRSGNASAANTLILRKDDQRPRAVTQFIGWDETCADVEQHIRRQARQLWNSWTPIDAFGNFGRSFVMPSEGFRAATGKTLFESFPVVFGRGFTDIRLYADLEFDGLDTRVDIDLIEIDRGWPSRRRKAASGSLTERQPHRFSIPTTDHHAYAVRAMVRSGAATVEAASLVARTRR